MKKHTVLFFFILSNLCAFSQIDLKGIKVGSTQLSETDIANGLKEALTVGATNASKQLNKTDGFYKNPNIKIPFPEEAQKVAKTLRELGYGKKVDDFEISLNRAAELAAKEAAPIFTDAIKKMTITDAASILKGPDTAATHYLKKTTALPLFKAFLPHIDTALKKTAATALWKDITKIYNGLPTTRHKVSTDLVTYTTLKALTGMYTIVAEEEKKIRSNPLSRTTDILKKVFGN